MVIAIFGESCTGKSTLAQVLATRVPCEVISGKDYLRLAKNENVAAALFRKKLQSALTGENIIYVILLFHVFFLIHRFRLDVSCGQR